MDITIETTKAIHGGWLTKKLNEAGIANTGVTPNGTILTLHGINPAQEQAARNIVDAYDPAEFVQYEARYAARYTGASAEARLATQLRTLTVTQAMSYIENNVTDLPSAKAALKIMTRIVMALWDRIFPDHAE